MAKRPVVVDKSLAAQGVLRPIHEKLQAIGGGDRNSVDSWHLDPVWRASHEILGKIGSPRVAELHRSSKLYRAIDDIESTALLMPKYRSSASELRAIASELRRISGWREGE